ncbi:MAG: hypothetical protein Q9207_007491 [Kuettlingeria erythrocarpa]
MSSLGYFFIFLLILVPLAALAYIFYARIQAQCAGRSPPSFASFIPFRNQQSHGYSSSSGGIINTIRSKIHSLTGTSRRTGAYEQPLGSSGRGRGLDPDGAWDTRVGDEADAYGSGGYYEEQELGIRTGGGGRGQQGAALPDYGDEEMGRGRSVSRDGPPPSGFIGGDQRGLNQRYDEATGGVNPFGDQAERSELKGMGAGMPKSGEKGHMQRASESIQGDSPTERRSMFHENM